jgi:hypothetical protein
MVKKFYMETKDSTLESAILDVWKNAAENNMSGENSFEMGTDRYRKHTQKITPGQMEETFLGLGEQVNDDGFVEWTPIQEALIEQILDMPDDQFDDLLEEMSYEQLIVFEGIMKSIGKGLGKVARGIGKRMTSSGRADVAHAKAQKKSDTVDKKIATKQLKKDTKQKKKEAGMGIAGKIHKGKEALKKAGGAVKSAAADVKAGAAEKGDTPPAAKEPAAKEPAAKEPAAKEPAAKEPAAKEPAAQEPAAKEPAAQEPAAKEPAAKEPAAKEPAAKEPAAKEPAAQEPAAKEPAAQEPAAKEPAAKEPAAKEPAAKEPAAKEPAAKKPEDDETEAEKAARIANAAREAYVPGYEYGTNQRLMAEQLAHVRMWQEAADTHVDPKDREELDMDVKNSAKKMKRAAEPKPMVATEGFISEGTKEEYEKFFSSAMKKFKINSPADLKSDEEKKKFFDYVDKNYKGEKSEELLKAVSEHGDWVNEKKLALAKEFKVSSMRQALEKVWNVGDDYSEDDEVEEGGMKRGKDLETFKPKPKEKKEEDDSVKKGGKTETGKKMAEVEIDPDLDEKNKK